MMNKFTYILIALSLLILPSCGGGKKEEKKEVTPKSQYNITILLDLSERIKDENKSDMVPSQKAQDISLINHVVDKFLKKMEKQGLYKAKGKIKVRIHPYPQTPDIAQLQKGLSVDLEYTGVDMNEVLKLRREEFGNMKANFDTSLSQIYDLALAQKNWIGSDIWRFFKEDVSDICMDKNPQYRNILVILTDGYIYHENSKQIQGNRYSYLLPSVFDKLGFRKSGLQIVEKMKELDFGLITTRKDLQDLEVLLLEVNPSKGHDDDYTILNVALSQWFEEMGIQHYDVCKTGVLSDINKRIDEFFSKLP